MFTTIYCQFSGLDVPTLGRKSIHFWVFSSLIFIALLGGCDTKKDSPKGTPPKGGAPSGVALPLEGILKKAKSWVREEQISRARIYLTEEAKRFQGTEKYEVLFLKAKLQIRSNMTVEAQDTLAELKSLVESDKRSLWLEGEIQRQLQQFDIAKTQLEACLKIDPNYLPALLSSARTYYRLQEGDKAVESFESYFKLLSQVSEEDKISSDELHSQQLELGRALRTQGEFQKAADKFAELLVNRPMNPPLYSELAQVQFRLGRRPQGQFLQKIYSQISRQVFQKHIEERLISSGMLEFGLSQRAFNLFNERRYLECINVYKTNIARPQPDSRTHSYYAQTLIKLFKPTEALKIVEEGLNKRLKPVSGLYLHRALALKELDNHQASYQAALQAWDALISEGDAGGPEKGQANPQQVWVLAVEGAIEGQIYPKAFEHILNASKFKVSNPVVQTYKLRLFARSKQKAQILSLFQELKSSGGQLPNFLFIETSRAMLAIDKGGQAVQQIASFLGKNPGNDEAFKVLEEARDEGIQMDPRLLNMVNQVSSVKQKRKELKKKIDAQAWGPALGETYIQVGQTYTQLRQNVASLIPLMVGVELNPSSKLGPQVLVGALGQNTDVFFRLKYLELGKTMDPENATYREALAKIYHKLGVRLDRAEADAKWLVTHKKTEAFEQLLKQIQEMRK